MLFRSHRLASTAVAALRASGAEVMNSAWFDTVSIRVPDADTTVSEALQRSINIRRVDDRTVSFSLDETTTVDDVANLLDALGAPGNVNELAKTVGDGIPDPLRRTGTVLDEQVFHRYHSEHDMLRYLRRLADKDLALDRTMIPLGSCTMKLNATSEMQPITWPEFANIHPYAPEEQTLGYRRLILQLEQMLVAITGYDAVSLQPNAGSQGELAGLLAIRAYHRSRGDLNRTVCLIPSSEIGRAHV